MSQGPRWALYGQRLLVVGLVFLAIACGDGPMLIKGSKDGAESADLPDAARPDDGHDADAEWAGAADSEDLGEDLGDDSDLFMPFDVAPDTLALADETAGVAETGEWAAEASEPDSSGGGEVGDVIEAVDTSWPSDASYTGIYAGLEDLSGEELASKLCSLVKSGYTQVSYSTASDLIMTVIDSYGGKVREIYTGAWIPGGNGLNIEHTWPQSKGASSLPAKSDLFHLLPSDPNFNSARGNLPYGEVVSMDWPSQYIGDASCTDHFPGNDSGCFSFRGKDAQGVQVFEPRDAVKGNIARGIFYFAIRYGNNCKVKSFKVLDPQHPFVTEALYKSWNHLDPPDTEERERNDRIEKYLHVRNPFIDHPEFVDRISFQ